MIDYELAYRFILDNYQLEDIKRELDCEQSEICDVIIRYASEGGFSPSDATKLMKLCIGFNETFYYLDLLFCSLHSLQQDSYLENALTSLYIISDLDILDRDSGTSHILETMLSSSSKFTWQAYRVLSKTFPQWRIYYLSLISTDDEDVMLKCTNEFMINNKSDVIKLWKILIACHSQEPDMIKQVLMIYD